MAARTPCATRLALLCAATSLSEAVVRATWLEASRLQQQQVRCQFGLESDGCPPRAETVDDYDEVPEWDPRSDGVCNVLVADRLDGSANHPVVLREAIARDTTGTNVGAPRISCYGVPDINGKRELQGALELEGSSDRSVVAELSSLLSPLPEAWRQPLCVGNATKDRPGFTASERHSVYAPLSENAVLFLYPPRGSEPVPWSSPWIKSAPMPSQTKMGGANATWWHENIHPALQGEERPLECTLRAGDAMIIPPGWDWAQIGGGEAVFSL